MIQNSVWDNWFSDHPWIVEIAVVLALLLTFNFLLKGFLIRSKRKAHLAENDWFIHLESIMLRPVQAILWICFISFVVNLLLREFRLEGNLSFIPLLRDAGIIICLSWLVLRWKAVFYNSIAGKRAKGKLSLDSATLELISKLFTVAVIFIVLMLLMQILGLNVLPLLTFGGIGAAALGFACKDVFANFFGGLMLNMTRPFTVNDLIELPQKKIMGHVENVGWYLTAIRDLQKKPIYIPNSFFSNELVINHSRITHRRMEESIGLRLADFGHCEPILAHVNRLIQSHADIDHNLPIHVYVQTLAPSSIDLGDQGVYPQHPLRGIHGDQTENSSGNLSDR